MGWDKGRYYTRSKRVNGRVEREYWGRGKTGDLAARLHELERQPRLVEQEAKRARKAELDALDAPLNELSELADLLGRAALVVAGYHQHRRGEWRKRRGDRIPTD